MSTVTKKGITKEPSLGGTPYGNGWKQIYSLITNASGIITDSDLSTAIQSGDVIRIGVLPEGLVLHDALSIISDAFTASSTFKVGFAYVDGVDDATVPQDDDYFLTATTAATAARLAANNTAVRPVKLPKDAYLIVTNGGAAQSAAGILDVIVEGVLAGV